MKTRRAAASQRNREGQAKTNKADDTREAFRAPKRKKLKIPKSLAAAADLYYETRTRRLDMEKDAEQVRKDEAELREHLINNLPKSQAGGIAGKKARVEISKRNVPKISNEKKFFAYAHRKGNEDLVKETMVVSAVQARWDEGKVVPGIEAFTVVGLSLHKLK